MRVLGGPFGPPFLFYLDLIVIRILIPITLLFSMATAHPEELQLEDGRRIKLHEDGTWTFISTDRLLGTADGRQVRLKEGGTWEYTGDMAPPLPAPSGEVTRASLGEVVFTVKELAIETARTATHKSSRKKTNTVFTLNLVNKGKTATRMTLDETLVAVEDSGGREYPLLVIKPEQVSLEPGQSMSLEVRVDGSPHWFTTKAMELHINGGADDELVLKALLSDAKKRELTGS